MFIYVDALEMVGVPVAQLVKCWPTDLAVPSSTPPSRPNLFDCKQGSVAHNLLLASAHRPDMTETLLKLT